MIFALITCNLRFRSLSFVIAPQPETNNCSKLMSFSDKQMLLIFPSALFTSKGCAKEMRAKLFSRVVLSYLGWTVILWLYCNPGNCWPGYEISGMKELCLLRRTQPPFGKSTVPASERMKASDNLLKYVKLINIFDNSYHFVIFFYVNQKPVIFTLFCHLIKIFIFQFIRVFKINFSYQILTIK